MPLGLTLTGLSTVSVIALAIVGVGALTSLYLVRQRRRRVVVPFIGLWVPQSGTGPVRRLARRLRHWLSWALQLAIFALVVVAAGDLKIGAGDASARTVLLLIDRSASMRAVDEPGSRLERAQGLARDVIAGLAPTDRAQVATFAGTIDVVTGVEEDRARLQSAINAITPSDEPGDLTEALAFAASLLRGRPGPTLIVISDGGGPNVDDRATVASLGKIDVRFLPVGRRGDNVAIVAFSARRLPADPSSVDIALTVQNFRDAPVDVSVAITAGPARIPVASRRLRLSSGERLAQSITGAAISDPRLEAVLENAADDLALDDRAYAVVPEPFQLRILVIGERNLYLDGALLGLGPTVRVDRVEPAAMNETSTGWDDYDVVIFDGVSPLPVPAKGRFLYIDPSGSGSPWPVRGTIADPVVTDVAREHLLVKHLSLADLNVAAARRLTLAAGDQAVVAALGTPLVVARARPNLRAVAVAFDLRRSDLPLRAAFPLFLANTLAWLANRAAPEAVSWPTGRTVRIGVDGAAAGDRPPRAADVTSPAGEKVRVPIVSGAVSFALNRAGFFDLTDTQGRGLARVAANLASAAESNLAPQPHLRIGNLAPQRPDVPPPRGRRDVGPLLLAAAIALCLIEWLTYHRRLTV